MDADEGVRRFLNTHGEPQAHRSAVVFDHMNIIGAGHGIQKAPTLLTPFANLAKVFIPTSYKTHTRTILHDFSGSINPGEMLLVIGRPGSGCTSFLKVLGGYREEYHDITGTIHFSGRPDSEKDKDRVRSTFVAEEDLHLPTLTVQETLHFALTTSYPATATPTQLQTATESLAALIGLSHTLPTRVGSAAIRGISGGERRRVSLAESLATLPDILCLDNPTNGLDSSTAREFIATARAFTEQTRCATAMAMYQGSDEMVASFDKVVVVNEGRMVFWGSSGEAKGYFEGLGYKCPERTTLSDFLTSMSADARLRHYQDGILSTRIPHSATELEAAFRQSPLYARLTADVATALATPSASVVPRQLFSLPLWRQLALCTRREFRVMITNYNPLVSEAIFMVCQAVFLGSIFLQRQHRTSARMYMTVAACFFTMLSPYLQALYEFGKAFAIRPLLVKHRKLRFYRPMCHAMALMAADLVWKAFVISFTTPQYFMSGFQRDAGVFWTWWFILYIFHLQISLMYRAISSFCSSAVTAGLPLSILFMAQLIYAGLYMPPPEQQVWLGWFRWINTPYYTLEAVVVNEMAGTTVPCAASDIVPQGPGITAANQRCVVTGSIPGELSVSADEYIAARYGFYGNNLWRNVGIIIAFYIASIIACNIGMEIYRPSAGKLATVHFSKLPAALSRSPPPADDPESGEKQQDSDILPDDDDDGLGNSGDDTDITHNGRLLAWKNLTLDVRTKDGPKRLLQGLNGLVQPGHLTALMGVSGAGKTTLLNTLAGRMEYGSIGGEICLDGHPLPKSFRRLMGYVQQQDIHLATQTVREALQLTARLRRPASVPLAEKYTTVETVISMLEMHAFSNALIGTPGSGLTLEQRKRVSIGVELAAHPDVLFLDEPTSGLDGQSALNIVRLLHRLARSGQTILCTIHQPAAEVIEYFDHLILLVRGGQVAYDGPLGPNCETALAYLEENSGVKCEAEANPAEYFLDIVGAGARTKNIVDWGQFWISSREAATQNTHRQASSCEKYSEKNTVTDSVTEAPKGNFALSIPQQFPIVMKRGLLLYWRDPVFFISQLSMNTAMGLLTGLSFLNTPHDDTGAQSLIAAIFVAIVVGPTLGLQTQGRYATFQDIFFLRERAANSYHWITFVLTAVLVHIPMSLVTSLICWVFWYFPTGFQGDAYHAGYTLLLWETFSVFLHTMAQMVMALMPSTEAAFMSNGIFFYFVNIFCGALIPKLSAPRGWRWAFNVSPLWYMSEGITTTALYGVQLHCKKEDIFSFELPDGETCESFAGGWIRTATGFFVDANATGSCQYCRYSTGQEFYGQYGYTIAHRWRNFGVFAAFSVLNILIIIAATYLLKIRKWRG